MFVGADTFCKADAESTASTKAEKIQNAKRFESVKMPQTVQRHFPKFLVRCRQYAAVKGLALPEWTTSL